MPKTVAPSAMRHLRPSPIEHNFPPDFPSSEVASGLITSLLSRGDVYSVVAEVDGRVVGSNFLWENGTIAGVGPITIDPAAQNAAVGRRLMEDVLQRARSGTLQGSDWFRPPIITARYRSTLSSGSTHASPSRTFKARPSTRKYPGTLSVRRPKRTSVLATSCVLRFTATTGGRNSSKRSDRIPRHVVEHGGRITGYTTTVGFFGHTVGESNEELKALIGAAPEFPGTGFPAADAQRRGVALVPGAGSAHCSADDPDEPWLVQRA